MRSINPATEEVVAEHADHSPDDVRRLLAKADDAFSGWRDRHVAERAPFMRRAAQVLRARSPELALLMTREMGKPIAQSEAEIEKCAVCCDHFADHARHYLAPDVIATDADRSYVRFDPLGGVLAIMPWNFPFWQVFRFAAPALIAGNV